MPFKSKAQQGYLYAKHPEVAKEFASNMAPKDFKKLPQKMADGGETLDPQYFPDNPDNQIADSGFKYAGEGPNHIMVEHPNGQQAPIALNGLEPHEADHLRSLPPSDLLKPEPSEPSPYAGLTSQILGDIGWNKTPQEMSAGKMYPNWAPTNTQVAMATPKKTPTEIPNQPEQTPDQFQLPAQQKMPGYGGMQGFNAAIDQNQKMVDDAAKHTETMIKGITDAYTTKINDNEARIKTMQDDVNNGKIDPNHFWAQKTGFKGGMSRVLSMIGLFLGGTPQIKTGVNPAQAMLDKAINDDIDAQKTELGKKNNLLKMYMDQGNTLQQAMQQAKLDEYNMIKIQLERFGAYNQNLQTKELANYHTQEIAAKMAEINQKSGKDYAEQMLRGYLGTNVIPDQVVAGLPENLSSQMVKVGEGKNGEGENVLVRNKEDVDKVKTVAEKLGNLNDILTQMRTLHEGGRGLAGYLPGIRHASTYEKSADELRGQFKDQIRQIGQTMRIGEYTNENFLDKLVPDITSTVPNPELIPNSLNHAQDYLDTIKNNLLSNRTLGYNPGYNKNRDIPAK